MLENEGFVWDSYVDVFDGGPTVTARTDDIRTVREAMNLKVADGEPSEGMPMMLAHGRLHDFAACYAKVEVNGEGAVIDGEARRMLGVKTGDTVLAVAR